jgi:hypothetical protein
MRYGIDLCPHRNDKIISREEWNRIKHNADQFYQRTSDEAIDLYNFKLKENNYIKTQRSNAVFPGVVYLLKSSNGYYKIGKAKNLQSRLSEIQRQYPVEIRVIHYINCVYPYEAERKLHTYFSHLRLWGEWFSLDNDAVSWLMSIKTDNELGNL